MSQLLMASIPGFFDLADSTIAAGQPLTDYAILKISHNAKFAVSRHETIPMGFYGPGDTVPAPVSSVDGYTYSYAVKIEAVSEGSTSRHSRTGSQALDEAESGGRPETAGGSSDACALQRRGAAVVDAHDPGPACDAQGSS